MEELNDHKTEFKCCLECGKELIGRSKKKFCSSSCAAKYNNKRRPPKSEEEKKKISNSLKQHYEEIYKDQEMERHIHDKWGHPLYKCVCVVCGNIFYSKKKSSKHCCSKCSGADPNLKQKLRDKIQERIDNGTFSGWKSRNITSYPEQFWINVLNNNNIPYIREDFTTKKYFLDFLIERNGIKIDLEIDGAQHKKRKQHDMERDKYLTNLGYTVYRIEWVSINNKKGKEIMKLEINKFLEFYNNLTH